MSKDSILKVMIGDSLIQWVLKEMEQVKVSVLKRLKEISLRNHKTRHL